MRRITAVEYEISYSHREYKTSLVTKIKVDKQRNILHICEVIQ